MKPDSNASPDAVTEDALHALVDGRLDPAQRSALLARLARDPQAHATWQAWQQQREALSGLHRDLLDAQLPPALAAAARRASAGRGQAERGWRWGGIAAGVLCAFGLGWTRHNATGCANSCTRRRWHTWCMHRKCDIRWK